MSDALSIEEIAPNHVVPVVVVDDAANAEPLAAALAAGGIGCAEVTLRTPAALDALAAMAQVDGFIVGAGTVVNEAQAEAAVEAGARFIVSPGLSAGVVRAAASLGVSVLPGVCTATEVMAALDLGLTTVKFFPAETSGGRPAIKALGGPFPQVRFVPTGGISAQTLPDYLAIDAVAAVGGSWLTPRELQGAGDWGAITALAHETSAITRKVRP